MISSMIQAVLVGSAVYLGVAFVSGLVKVWKNAGSRAVEATEAGESDDWGLPSYEELFEAREALGDAPKCENQAGVPSPAEVAVEAAEEPYEVPVEPLVLIKADGLATELIWAMLDGQELEAHEVRFVAKEKGLKGWKSMKRAETLKRRLFPAA